MIILGDEILQDTALIKLLSSPTLLSGYLSGGKYSELSLSIAKIIVQRKMDDLYLAAQNYLGSEGIELTFKDKECYDWWHTAVDNVKVVQEMKSNRYNAWEPYTEIPTGFYFIEFPRPPKYIFEEI